MHATQSNPIALSKLEIGSKAVIEELKNQEIALKLIEMGLLPGTSIQLVFKVAWGGPLCIEILGYRLSLRRDEAASVMVSQVNG